MVWESAFDFVSPPGDGHFPPSVKNSRVMIFFISQLGDPVGEGQRLTKILELE